MKTLLKVFIASCWFFNLFAQESILAIQYVNKPYAIVHDNASRYSVAQTTLTCGFPVKVIGDMSVKEQREWYRVQAGEYKGFIQGTHISMTRVECIQEKYPKFFSELNLDLNELYHYGKLFDQMTQLRPKVQ